VSVINKQEIEHALAVTLEDEKLSANEKSALRQLFETFGSDAEILNFVRNRAFQLVAEQLRQNPDKASQLLKWLEQVVKTVDNVRNVHVAEPATVHFSPGKACADRIIALLQQAKKSIEVCVFTISDNRISKELLLAHERGVKVRVITDNDKSNDRGSDITYLVEKGVAVRMDTSPSHMHHKFAIFDNRQLVNGSFNWTRSASDYNQENIVVTGDPGLVKAFHRMYLKLWDVCKPA